MTFEEELNEARRRLERGEPISTTAAELGLTPLELTEALEEDERNATDT